jgi:hypothetical protein
VVHTRPIKKCALSSCTHLGPSYADTRARALTSENICAIHIDVTRCPIFLFLSPSITPVRAPVPFHHTHILRPTSRCVPRVANAHRLGGQNNVLAAQSSVCYNAPTGAGGNTVAGNPVAGNPVAGNPVAGNPVGGFGVFCLNSGLRDLGPRIRLVAMRRAGRESQVPGAPRDCSVGKSPLAAGAVQV